MYEYNLPPSYYARAPTLRSKHLKRFSVETLFYIFYQLPRDVLQAYAARELGLRGWLYCKEEK